MQSPAQVHPLLPGSSAAFTVFPHLRRKCWPWAAVTSSDPSSKSTSSAVRSLSPSLWMGQEGNHRLVLPLLSPLRDPL